MRVSRTNSAPADYLLNNTSLTSVTSYKYLGVYIASDLSWQCHINYIINNANRSLGYLRRNFSKAPLATKLILYKSLVRSKLEYASSVWDPGLSKLIHSLELVQNNSARFILSNYHRTSSITSMKKTLSLPSLVMRRKIARLCLFHKIYHHQTLSHQFISRPFYVSSRRDHCHKVYVTTCNHDSFFHSFVPRTASEWNCLPSDLVSLVDNVLFHAAITNFVHHQDL